MVFPASDFSPACGPRAGRESREPAFGKPAADKAGSREQGEDRRDKYGRYKWVVQGCNYLHIKLIQTHSNSLKLN